jgi:glyoxylase-like metal-dependent hydrolase (beta-lactamase superfamily II)
MHPADSAMAEQGDMFLERGKVNILVRKLVPLLFGYRKAERFSPDIRIEAGFDFSAHGFDLRSIHLPGHSKGSIGLLTAQGELICGDLLENIKTPGLNSLQQDSAAALASLHSLKNLDVKCVYPGHGEPFSLDLAAWQLLESVPGSETQ